MLGDFGITWDEPVHFASGDLYLNRILDPGEVLYFSESDFQGAMQYYGPFFDIWGALNYRIFFEGLGWLAGDNARHLHLLIAGFLTVVFTYLLVKKALSPRIAVFSALFLIAFPRFIGHSFNNPKDIPLACIFVISVYFYYLRLTTGKKRFSMLLLVAGGIGFATRFQYVMLPVLIITFTIIYICIKNIKQNSCLREFISFWDVFAAIILCLPLGILFWPYFWSDTLVKLQRMAEFYIYHPEQAKLLIRYWGEDYIPGQNMPWHYAPVMLIITTPLITLGAFLLGLLRIISWNKRKGDDQERRLFLLLPVLWIVIGITPFIIPGQRVYGGIRHFLFIVPALCIIAAIGMEALVKWTSKKIKSWSYMVVAGLFLLLFVSVYSYHPYYTVYYNKLVGGPQGALERFSLENWGNSYKKACKFINNIAPPNATILVMLIPDVPRFYLRPDIRVVGQEYAQKPGAMYDYSLYIIRDIDLLKKKDKEPIFSISVKGQPICNVHQW
ncbi:MAG: glycosyltransferase family 39 protein [Candidatus Auribacterota bacterium]|nr:glycosyltransferase family 39 protein [Candidatus Auribacterota bacterium]